MLRRQCIINRSNRKNFTLRSWGEPLLSPCFTDQLYFTIYLLIILPTSHVFPNKILVLPLLPTSFWKKGGGECCTPPPIHPPPPACDTPDCITVRGFSIIVIVQSVVYMWSHLVFLFFIGQEVVQYVSNKFESASPTTTAEDAICVTCLGLLQMHSETQLIKQVCQLSNLLNTVSI